MYLSMCTQVNISQAYDNFTDCYSYYSTETLKSVAHFSYISIWS